MSGHFPSPLLPIIAICLFQSLSGLCINRKWQTIGYISDSLFKRVNNFCIFCKFCILASWLKNSWERSSPVLWAHVWLLCLWFPLLYLNFIFIQSHLLMLGAVDALFRKSFLTQCLQDHSLGFCLKALMVQVLNLRFWSLLNSFFLYCLEDNEYNYSLL